MALHAFTNSQVSFGPLPLPPPKKRKLAKGSDAPPSGSDEDDNSGNLSESFPPHESDLVWPDAMFFKSSLHQSLWDCVTSWTFLREITLLPEKANHISIIDLLHDVGLAKTVLNVPSFVKQVVIEFYCNLSLDVAVTGKMFIRGINIEFSPEVINSYMGFVPIHGVNVARGLHLVVSELTRGVIKSWARTGGIRASSMSFKYSVLHKIALRNWLPNSHSSVVRTELADLLYRIAPRAI